MEEGRGKQEGKERKEWRKGTEKETGKLHTHRSFQKSAPVTLAEYRNMVEINDLCINILKAVTPVLPHKRADKHRHSLKIFRGLGLLPR